MGKVFTQRTKWRTTMIEAMAIVVVMAIVAIALGPDDDLIDIKRD